MIRLILLAALLLIFQPAPGTASPEGPGGAPAEDSLGLPPRSPDTEDEDGQAVYPGVETATAHGENSQDIALRYPVLGQEKVDADMAAFARNTVAHFEKIIREDGGERPENYASFELSGTYELSRPCEDVLSVLFNVYSFTGGAHGMRDITCLNYFLPEARRLELPDLFARPQTALEIMSAYARAKLPGEIGQDFVMEDLLESGTAPDAANFANLVLLPDGLRMEFEPYQVGPWAVGVPRIFMPLAELAPAGPSRLVWPNAPDSPPDAEPGRQEVETPVAVPGASNRGGQAGADINSSAAQP